MRLIGSIQDAQQAEQFVAYLLTEGIDSHVEKESGVWEVWVKDEDLVDQASQELTEFVKDPTQSRYTESLSKAVEIQRQRENKIREQQKNMVDVKRSVSTEKKAPLTILLIVLCVIVGLATSFGSERSVHGVVFRALSFTAVEPPLSRELVQKYDKDYENPNLRAASILRGEVWRLFTPIFIHFGPVHFIFNMIWLFQLGRMIEDRYQTFWFAVLVLVTAAISNLAQMLVPYDVGGSVAVLSRDYLLVGLGGMSGVVYGLFGFIWVKSIYDPSSRMVMPQSTVVIMIAWLFFCPFLVENVANWAHGVGLVVGMLSGYLPNLMNGSSSWKRV